MLIKIEKQLKLFSVAVYFTFAFSLGPVWAESKVTDGHHAGASPHGNSEGSGTKKHYRPFKSQSHKKHEGSRGQTWGRGVYKKGYLNSSKHVEGSGSNHHAKKYGYRGHGKKVENSHGSRDPFRHVLKFKSELGLTEAQVIEIKNQQFKYEKVSIRSHADHKIAHMELDRVIHSENIDEIKARQLAEKIAESKTQKIKAMVEGKLAVMRILTADQKIIISRMYNLHN